MSDLTVMTEPDVIVQVLDDHRVRDSSRLAQLIHSALIRRRLAMLTRDIERRENLGLA